MKLIQVNEAGFLTKIDQFIDKVIDLDSDDL